MNSFTVTNPTDIFTLIMNVYGTLETSMLFVSDNTALIPSLNADVIGLAGEAVYYDATLVVTALFPKPVLSTAAAPVLEYTWMGREGQNMFDVCIQTYGILDDQIKLLTDNNVELTSPVFEQKFNYNSTLIANSSMWNHSTGMGIIFSTGIPDLGSYDESFEFSSFEDTTEVDS